MKTIKIISILSLIYIISVASMCSDDDDVTPLSTNYSSTLVSNTVKSGNWRITYFNDSGTDETSNFTGYAFTFGNSNVLTATNTSNTYTGSWSITDSNSNDDSISDLDFNIGFTTPPNFEELTEDWEILSRTDIKIELKHISGGGGGTDYLTFEKN